MLALWGAVLRANKDTIVRTTVVIYVSFYNIRHDLIATLKVNTVVGVYIENIYQHASESVEEFRVLARTNNGLPIRLDMDFCKDVPEAEQASGDHWDWVAFVIYPREIRHLRVEERSPSHISDARSSKRDSSDGRARRQINRHE